MTQAEELAEFVEKSSFDTIPKPALDQLKIRIIDSIGCCIGALDHKVPMTIREQVEEFGGNKRCTLIGGGRSAPDRAAFYNGTLLRYLDFMDSYLGVGQTCHPSDNLGSVLAACEYSKAGGKEFLTALAIAYEIQCRLIDAAPAEKLGFDHVIHLSYSAAAGVAKGLGLGKAKIANAIAISGTAYQGFEVTRAGQLSNWKGIASANAGFGATHATFLAKRGITGPMTVFEGPGGLFNAVKRRFKIRWSAIKNLDAVLRTSVKKYNVEAHAQSTIEAIMELRHENVIEPKEILEVGVEVFHRAYNVIGGGEIGGDKRIVETKEQADHSLPYAVAVSLLDGELTPKQYSAKRINSSDVQTLLRKVAVKPSREKTDRYPEEMPSRVEIKFRGGEKIAKSKNDYEGFHTRPMSWEDSVQKFNFLSKRNAEPSLRKQIILAIEKIDEMKSIGELMKLLSKVQIRN